jgi:hypothetical protein
LNKTPLDLRVLVGTFKELPTEISARFAVYSGAQNLNSLPASIVMFKERSQTVIFSVTTGSLTISHFLFQLSSSFIGGGPNRAAIGLVLNYL